MRISLSPWMLALAALLSVAITRSAPAQTPGQPAAGAPFATLPDLTADSNAWKAMPSDGVEATISTDTTAAADGRPCLRLDFSFKTGGGFVVVQRPLQIALPENYEFAFRVKGDSKRNNLEFKLLDPPTNNDPTISSVWWVNKPAYEFTPEWTPVAYKRRHFTFAWGPNGGQPHKNLGAIEFAIASNQGGNGTIWFDGLAFRELPVVRPYTGTPTASANVSVDAEHGPEKAIDGDNDTGWNWGDQDGILTIDFGQVREFGGLDLQWLPWPELGATLATSNMLARGRDYDISLSNDGETWTTFARHWAGSDNRDFHYLPDSEARFVRITGNYHWSEDGPRTLGEVRVISLEAASSLNNFIAHVASQLPRGSFPRWAYGEQSFWTVLGVPDNLHEALINEEGQIEVGKQGFSIEPFVRKAGRLLTWADGTHVQSLAGGRVPVVTVERRMENATLRIRAAVVGPSDEPMLAAVYTLTADRGEDSHASLCISVRPYQVNPPAQFLNSVGGVASIRDKRRVVGPYEQPTSSDDLLPEHDRYWTQAVEARNFNGYWLREDGSLEVNGDWIIIPVVSGTRGNLSFNYPCANELLTAGHPRTPHSYRASIWTASGQLNEARWLQQHSAEDVRDSVFAVLVPFSGASRPSWLPADITPQAVSLMIDATEQAWKQELTRATLSLPPSAKAIEDTFYAQQAYILINRDGPGFQPGSRSYERSWIRDGSMTSAAMLQLGHAEMVKEFVRWYAGFQFPDGKVPCVVDSRGPDPVPENDSHGQLIMAIANVHRYTHDAAFVREHFEHVRRAVAYIEKLRAERMTSNYTVDSGKTKQEPGKPAVPLHAMHGLVPESISHEGYSAKPMHSYWDDLYVYRGLKDAAYCAGVVGDDALKTQWTSLANDFGQNLVRSYALTMKTHGIDYLPGCVELGDFDATSTTIALWPVQAQDILPHAAIERTFDKYWEFFTHRRDNPRDQWDAYTPYELRVINAFVHLGQRDRALQALDWFMKDQYPSGWRHWAEVVHSNPRATKFIGDMPHTWCGSDFLNSLRSMFVYEDEASDSLVMFGGVPEGWAREGEGVSIRGFRTYHGTINASAKARGRDIVLSIDSPDFAMPTGGIVVRWSDADEVSATVNGRAATKATHSATQHAPPGIVVRELPAEIVITPPDSD